MVRAHFDVGRVFVLSVLQNESQKSFILSGIVFVCFFNKFCFSSLHGHSKTSYPCDTVLFKFNHIYVIKFFAAINNKMFFNKPNIHDMWKSGIKKQYRMILFLKNKLKKS